MNDCSFFFLSVFCHRKHFMFESIIFLSYTLGFPHFWCMTCSNRKSIFAIHPLFFEKWNVFCQWESHTVKTDGTFFILTTWDMQSEAKYNAYQISEQKCRQRTIFLWIVKKTFFLFLKLRFIVIKRTNVNQHKKKNFQVVDASVCWWLYRPHLSTSNKSLF